MDNFLSRYKICIGDQSETPFLNRFGIYQDGTTPLFRDTDGKLWAMSGHSHAGHIGMFCGTSLDDLKELYPINTLFCVGHAEYAYAGIRYPEGIKPRGSIWPFGLYICPGTHRFFCLFHNETGWNGMGTAYDSLGLCDTPRFDSDFRHIGLMHSDDEGKNWVFDRWILTSESVCFTEKYNPGAGKMLGQASGRISLGSGDFSLYTDPYGEYIYLVYNIIHVNMETGAWEDCDVYIARSRKRSDGVMGDFVKYYEGAFCEAGNFGKETPIAHNSWHARIVYLKKYKKYILTSSPMRPEKEISRVIEDVMEVRESEDLLHWSEPVRLEKGGQAFGNHYVAMVADDRKNPPNVIEGDEGAILSNHNGTNVDRFRFTIEKK